jgi:flagellar biosynthesis component FlhA
MDDYGNELPATTLQQVNKRFNQGSERMAAIERDLKAATQELQERNQQMAELLEFFTAMKGAFKVLNWVGKVAKPLAAIVMLGGACVGFWTAVKGGAGR